MESGNRDTPKFVLKNWDISIKSGWVAGLIYVCEQNCQIPYESQKPSISESFLQDNYQARGYQGLKMEGFHTLNQAGEE